MLAPVVIAVLAVCAFPLGPVAPLARALSAPAVAVAIAAAVAAVAVAVRAARASAGAAVTAAVLLAALLALPHYGAGGSRCPGGPSISYLGSVPKNAVIAGDPFDLRCLPVTARRAVVTSTQLAPSYEAVYFRHGRERMFALLRALYGPSLSAVADLRTRYGATHLWVRSAMIRRELAGRGFRWRPRRLPYGRYVRGSSPRAGRPPCCASDRAAGCGSAGSPPSTTSPASPAPTAPRRRRPRDGAAR